MRDEFEINILDISKGSNKKVKVRCDYCGTIYEKSYNHYILQNEKSEIHKDCCEKCMPKKLQEVILKKYGVKSMSQLESVKQIVTSKSRHPYEFIKNEFTKKNCILITKIYENNKQILEYICLRHFSKGIQETTYNRISKRKGSGCKYCRGEAISKSKLKEKHPNWKGGITGLIQYLRSKIGNWKYDSLVKYHFRCAISGERKDLIIHHLYSFKNILMELLDKFKIPLYSEINRYTTEELNLLEEKCIELHYKYGLGIPLTKTIHKLFHTKYGIKNNTPEQFNEFKIKYLNGEFNTV